MSRRERRAERHVARSPRTLDRNRVAAAQALSREASTMAIDSAAVLMQHLSSLGAEHLKETMFKMNIKTNGQAFDWLVEATLLLGGMLSEAVARGDKSETLRTMADIVGAAVLMHQAHAPVPSCTCATCQSRTETP